MLWLVMSALDPLAGYELLICCYLMFLVDGPEFSSYLIGGVSFGVFSDDEYVSS